MSCIRRLNVLTVVFVAPVDIAKKQAEIAKARSGENTPQAIITCIEAAMRSSSCADSVLIKEMEFKQLMVGRPDQGLEVHVLHETCVHQISRLDSEAG